MKHLIYRVRLLSLAALITLVVTACAAEQDADPDSGFEVSDGGTDIAFDPKLDNFGRPTPVKLCHRTLAGAYPFVTLYVDPSDQELHRLHGDIVPAPPEGCGDILDVDIPLLPGGPIEPVDSTSQPTVAATQVPATIVPTSVPPTPAATKAPTEPADPPVAGRCAEGDTLAALITTDQDYEKLAEALYQSGLLRPLADTSQTYLLFIPDKKVKRDELTDFLLAHVVVIDHPVSSSDVLSQGTLTTLGGQSISIAAEDGKLMLNGDNRAKPLLTACNGVVYTIERPLDEKPKNRGRGHDKDGD